MYRFGKWVELALRVEISFTINLWLKNLSVKGIIWITHDQKEVCQFRLQYGVLVVMFRDSPTCVEVKQSLGVSKVYQ